jgi:pantetheine-phosphate adenylyltransferase
VSELKIAIYPGTFDPITFGHIDIIERAAKIFDKIIVVIAVNSKKVNLFNPDERLEMSKVSLSHLQNVEIEYTEGILIDYAVSKKATAIIRGIRTVTDYDYEMMIAMMNRKMQPEISTLFLMPHEKYSFLNSSVIREISKFGKDVSEFVPQIVQEKLKDKYK